MNAGFLMANEHSGDFVDILPPDVVADDDHWDGDVLVCGNCGRLVTTRGMIIAQDVNADTMVSALD